MDGTGETYEDRCEEEGGLPGVESGGGHVSLVFDRDGTGTDVSGREGM